MKKSPIQSAWAFCFDLKTVHTKHSNILENVRMSFRRGVENFCGRNFFQLSNLILGFGLDKKIFLCIIRKVESKSGCRIVAIITAFQAVEGGSIPPTRSNTIKNTRTEVLVFFIVIRIEKGNRRVF